MGDFILILDSDDDLKLAVERNIGDAPYELAHEKDIAKAKRRLLAGTPKLVLSKLSLGADQEAGLRFCQELRGHTTLSTLPVLLFSSSVNQDTLRRAAEVGAKSLITWPAPGPELIRRIKQILPDFGDRKGIKKKSSAAKPAEKPKAAKKESSPVADDPKLQLAQEILAKVLHNLRTSDLLRVVEDEDVPRVVYEITRGICGIGQDEEVDKSQSQSTSVDLGSVFGAKK